MPKTLTTKQKCEKLARVLETVASKISDPNMGEDIWKSEEPTLQILVAQLSILLKRADKLSKQSDIKNTQIEDDWPDIILD